MRRIDRHRARRTAELLVHPHLVADGQLVDLGDHAAVDQEDRHLTARADRLHERLRDPGAADWREGRMAAQRLAEPTVERVGDDDQTGTARADPWLDDRGAELGDRRRELRVAGGQPRRHGRDRIELGEVGLVVVPLEHVGAVEQSGRVQRARPREELLGADGRSPRWPGSPRAKPRPSRRRSRPTAPTRSRCPRAVSALSSASNAGLALAAGQRRWRAGLSCGSSGAGSSSLPWKVCAAVSRLLPSTLSPFSMTTRLW